MIYLSQLVGNPVLDAKGERIGRVNDLGIATGEVFPRITSLAVEGPGRTPFMISWRKYVDSFDESEIHLKVVSTDIRFSYLQPDEVLVARDLLNKQIVDTRGARVVRVNDLKLSDTNANQLRLLGAEVGIRGLLRSLSPALERLVLRLARSLGRAIPERIIAWNYMDLIDRDLSNVKLSVSHKTLDELHPADIADIIEKLDPRLRGQVFAQLDEEQAADAIAELADDSMAAELMDDMNEDAASRLLSEMDPDDAAELVSELDYDKAEKLLRLMGVKERKAINQLLGYRENTAGRIMTSEAVSLPEQATVADAVAAIRSLDEDFEAVNYIYLKDDEDHLSGVVSLRNLISHDGDLQLSSIAHDELVTAGPDDDQEDVAKDIAKYNLLAMPVVDDAHRLLGIVTVDDALDVLEEEHEEDLQIAGAGHGDSDGSKGSHDILWLCRNELWFLFWMIGFSLLAALLGTGMRGEVMALGFAMPAAIVAALDSATFVTNFFIENDPDDEDSPSVAGFTVKGIGLGLLFAAFIALVSTGIFGTFFAGPFSRVARVGAYGFTAAAASVLLSFVLCPLYLIVLRRRESRGRETSGLALQAIAMAIAVLAFVGIVSALMNGMGA
ncbi:magnesium transporter MgtE N-terminal domain-containing protein [Olsenella profusa]|uniref:MgtE intracellular N-terminal domain protein n=1 Tax=Olsenella profusa F0195 TaxID=1125712 RepID=U2UZX2_9ACTN|nr:CBS domain-containing protein [Olsenella profusa]ERL05981.1 MgtE intracellular N-terminal domain protein [Olsenella profusa F0195]